MNNMADLIRAIPGHRRDKAPEQPVKGIRLDSRMVGPGDIFVAVKGVNADGHDYAESAAINGAAVIVVERDVNIPTDAMMIKVRDSRKAYAALCHEFYKRPSEKLSVVGVTGTNGKTTTCFILRSLLRAAGHPCGLIGTIVNDLGAGPEPSPMTTPDAADIHRMLATMVESGMTHAVMEVSSHALQQRRTDYIRFAAGVFTNLTQDHLDYHGNMSSYRRAKGRLFNGLSANGFAILNADDPSSERFTTKADKVWFSLSAHNVKRIDALGEPCIYAEAIDSTLNGSRFLLRTKGEERLSRLSGDAAQSPLFPVEEVGIPLVGAHNVSNTLAAIAAAVALGCPPADIVKGLRIIDPVPGRLERVDARGDSKFHVLVDYAHTDNGLESILSALRPITPRRLIVVFGAGGDRDRKKRPKMGRAVEKYADLAFITSDNPRSEEPMKIIEDIYNGVERNGIFRKNADRRMAIRDAVFEASQGDVVVIAGKGHEATQTFRDGAVPFDDRLIAREFLQERTRRA